MGVVPLPTRHPLATGMGLLGVILVLI